MAVYHLGELSSGFARGMLAKDAQKQSDAQMALKLFGQLLGAETPEQQASMRAVFSSVFPHINIQGNVPLAPTEEIDVPGLGKRRMRVGEVKHYAPFFAQASNERIQTGHDVTSKAVTEARAEAATAMENLRATNRVELQALSHENRNELARLQRETTETLRKMEEAGRNQRFEDLKVYQMKLADVNREFQIWKTKFTEEGKNSRVNITVNAGQPTSTTPGGQDEYTQETRIGRNGRPYTLWKNKAGAYFTEEQMRARAGVGGDENAARAIGSGGKTTRNVALIQREISIIDKQLVTARARHDENSVAALENKRIELSAEMDDARVQQGKIAPVISGRAPAGEPSKATRGVTSVPPAPSRPIVPTPAAKTGGADPNAPPLDPKMNKGVTKRNTVTGDTYYSDGTKWIKQ